MKIGPERDALPRLLAFVYAPLGLAVRWLFEHPVIDLDRVACPLLQHTGIACPTCGGTRAGLALGRLDPATACAENPLIALLLIMLGAWFVYAVLATLLPFLRRTVRFTTGEWRVLRLLAVGAVMGTWVYEIIRHSR
ncbi:DUF2752 domain-containing protein [bacterium]|nr:DUF2752 domain-containing protein [bacterium]MBU1675681.1 DUF2752 domain-containing protein [bacterium]